MSADVYESAKMSQLGQNYLKAGNYVVAMEKAQEALKLFPNNADAWKLMHDCLREKGGMKEAQEFAYQWFEAMPDSRSAYGTLLVDTLVIGKDKKKSKSLYDGYVARYPDNLHDLLVLELLYEMSFGDKNRATKLADSLVSEFPEDAGFLAIQAVANYEANRCDLSYMLAKKALSIAPDHVGALRMLALSAFRELKFAEARDVAIRGLKVEPDFKVFHIIKNVSLFGYVPVFWFASLVTLLGLRVSGKLQLSKVGSQISNVLTVAGLTYFALIPIIQKLAIALASIGISGTYTWMMWGCVAWLIIPELMFTGSDREPKKKASAVKLDDY